MPDHTQNLPLSRLAASGLCKVMIHTILDRKLTCYELPVETFLGNDYTLDNLESGIRWIHMPVNNMAWVEECIKKCNKSYRLQNGQWTLNVRPALSKTIKVPLHSRHMEPKCNWRDRDDALETGFPLSTLYLPYMNWDEYRQFLSLREVYSRRQKNRPLVPVQSPASHREIIEHEISQYLVTNASTFLHPRRTLDQFYYSSLSDTKSRDCDQTISKWTGSDVTSDGRNSAADNSLMVMVDQLWCWVLDDKTVISCFPSHDVHYQVDGFRDLYESLKYWAYTCETVWDLQSIIVEQAITHLFSPRNRKFIDPIEIYRWVTSKKTAYQTMYFQDFHQNYTDGSTALHDERELKLVLEVVDIIDELKMIKHLLEKQREVVRSLVSALSALNPHKDTVTEPLQRNDAHFHHCTFRDQAVFDMHFHSHAGSDYSIDDTRIMAQRIAGQAGSHVTRADEHLESVLANVNLIKSEAEETYQSLLELLDLKQKTASLAEARSTTKQGQAVMLFTIVTIIFLPLSFFTSYFGQNVSEITGDEENPSSWDLWKVGTPISIVVIFVALLFAFHIMRPYSWLWFWKKPRRSSYTSRV